MAGKSRMVIGAHTSASRRRPITVTAKPTSASHHLDDDMP